MAYPTTRLQRLLISSFALWAGLCATSPLSALVPLVKGGAVEVRLDATAEAFIAFDGNRPRHGRIDGRIFDPRHGEFALSDMMFGLEAETAKTSGRIAVWRGWTPTVIYGGEPVGPIDWSLLQEAWGAVRATESLSLGAGLFSSPIGVESTFARDNWCWSSSQLNLAMPFYLTGARAQLAVDKATTLEAGLYGGWTRNVASNIPSTFVVRAFGAPDWGIWQVLISGAQTRPGVSVAGVGMARGWLLDAFFSAPVGGRLELAAQAQLGAETWTRGRRDMALAPWAAATLYARLALSPHWKATARAEVFWQGGPRQQLAGETLGRLWWPVDTIGAATLSAEWRPAPQFLIRADLRMDVADAAMFDVHDGSSTGIRPTASLGVAWTL